MFFRPRLRAFAALLAAAVVAVVAAPASASVRASGSLRCTSNGDWPPASSSSPLQPAISVEPGNTLRRVVTIDFDQDGDLDVLAATDRGVRVFLNDGQGNLVVQPVQKASPIVDLTGVGPNVGTRQDSSESIQNDLPSYGVQQSCSSATIDAPRALALSELFLAPRDASRSCLAPRAPPA
ncbi:MAG TPA: VCBS repeat-containing protein [Vicinamibacterales bacterium]|jgi:hypothetical protein|nr:VCBS repeat-containing protein [Vicinamibacterales bacterium]